MSSDEKPNHANRLVHANSPYLLQHAHNPVDWFEWGPEAFQKAERENKPIFLSIGYAACHWCHVMEHESFEDEAIARILNEHFVSVKVDREERPDVDEIYMQATVAMNQGRGGWPMSVFLTPQGRPFFAGTYFPRDHFLALLTRIQEVWSTQKDLILNDADKAGRYLQHWAQGSPKSDDLITHDTVDQVALALTDYFDMRKGGIRSDQNKFPPSMSMELMLRVHRRERNAKLLEAVEVTLDHMARGGIYDHLGGGICRYSTDPDWLVPHFEKMLYDQALVSSIYLDAYQATRNSFYAATASDIFDYVVRDLQSPEGGFYSTRDADSDGLEGAYYVWTVDQIKAILGQEDAFLFCDFYDVTGRGNWFESMGHAPKGPKNILHVPVPLEAFAQKRGLVLDEFRDKLGDWRMKLLEARSKRTSPLLDDKILTEWNGLMIAALAKGSRVLDRPEYAQAASRAADFVLKELYKDGRLLRSYRQGRAQFDAYLSDYAFFIEGLLNLYEATFERRWLGYAVQLNDTLILHYFDENQGGFFHTADDAESLIVRTKNPRDGALPSGNSVQAMNLLRLSILFDRKNYREKAESIFKTFHEDVKNSPAAHEKLLCAVDFFHDEVREIAIIGDRSSQDVNDLIQVVFDRYLPNKVVVQGNSETDDEDIPLLRERKALNGRATAYVCVNYVCQLPVTEPEILIKQLSREQ